MRLTSFKNRTARAMAALALAASAGCQKLPYIDQSKAVPHDSMGTIEQEDKEVKQATYLGTMPMQHAQDGEAEDDQRPRGARNLADDPPGGDQDRPG